MTQNDNRPTQNLITIKEASKMFNLSTRTLYDHIKSDPTFPYVNVGLRKKYLIDLAEFQIWLTRRTNQERSKYLAIPSLNQLLGGNNATI